MGLIKIKLIGHFSPRLDETTVEKDFTAEEYGGAEAAFLNAHAFLNAQEAAFLKTNDLRYEAAKKRAAAQAEAGVPEELADKATNENDATS